MFVEKNHSTESKVENGENERMWWQDTNLFILFQVILEEVSFAELSLIEWNVESSLDIIWFSVFFV